MVDISELNKNELKDLLKKIKLLDYLKKSLWKKWILEYNKITNWKNFYKVEYYDFWGTSLPYFKWMSVTLFDKLFWLTISENDIEFISNKNLEWGIRVFLNDNMFDLSYQRFEKLLK